MRKAILTAVALMLVLAIPSSAATTLSKVTLIVEGKRVPLSSSTGHVQKSNGRVMLPLKAVCDALSVSYSQSKNGKQMFMEGPGSTRVAVSAGYAYAKVNGKKKALRTRAYVKGGLLMADLSVLRWIGARYKTASKSALSKRGYPGAAVSVSMADTAVTFPTLAADSSGGGASQKNSFAADLPAASSCDQMVVVKYKSGSSATLTMHEKTDGVWKQILSSTAYVGKNGIGKTREGDKKTPTGTFNLKAPFGIKSNPGTSLSYLKVTKYHFWCGQSGSKYYNQLIDTRVTDLKRTASDEYLINYKGVYNYCAFIDYNASGEAGKGSCIFLHCTGSKKYTAGCVAVPESVMVKILKNMKSGCKIVIY